MIKLSICKASGDTIQISVEDSGYGISEENQKRLFADFAKISETKNINL